MNHILSCETWIQLHYAVWIPEPILTTNLGFLKLSGIKAKFEVTVKQTALICKLNFTVIQSFRRQHLDIHTAKTCSWMECMH